MYIPENLTEILFTEEQLKERVSQLGEVLTKEYSEKNPLFVCILKGAVVFFSDLLRAVKCPLEIEFFRASSYAGTASVGTVKAEDRDIPDIKGRDVVIVEDIIDTARTLSKVKEMFLRHDPNSLKIVCLLDKPARREVKDFTVDHSCFEIDDLFVVGYGLDCDQRFRNLPYIGVYNA